MAGDQGLFDDVRLGVIEARPALPIAVLLIAGIATAFFAPIHPSIWFLAAAMCAIVACVSRRYSVSSSIALAIGTFLVAISLAQLSYFRAAADDVACFTSDTPVLATLELSIDHAPVMVYPQSPAGRPMPPKQIIVARALSINGQRGTIPVTGDVLVELSHPNPWIDLGQRVRAVGSFGRATAATNPGQFDWASYYRQRGLIAVLQIGHPDNITKRTDDGIAVIGWLRQEARHLLSSGFTARRMTDYALIRALVLGDSDPDSRDVQDAFAQVGIAYQLAISGMHIAILATAVYLLCRLSNLRPRWTIAICAAVVMLYGVIALPTISAMRAVMVCIAFLFAPLLSRRGDKLQLLSLAAIAILLINPLDVMSIGFQLGFATVAGLCLFAPVLLDSFTNQLDRLSGHVQTAWPVRVWIFVRGWLGVSFIAWVVSLPLVAIHFGAISPWAIVAGLVIFPLVFVTLIGGWMKMVVTLLWPSAAVAAARVLQIPSFAMRLLAIRLTHLPGASVTISPPPMWMIVLYYALLGLTLLPFPRAIWRRAFRGGAMIGVGGFLLVLVGAAPVVPTNLAETTITLLNVGAGQCAIIDVPHDGITLVDCGSDSIADVAHSVLIPYLQLHHARTIARVFLSHSDYDHISALGSILPMVNGPIYTSEYFSHFAAIDPPAAALLKKLNDLGRSPIILRKNEHVSLGRDASIDVLWPVSGSTFNCNDTGLVLRLNCDNRKVLFPADIQANAMRRLLATSQSLAADVLVAAHHGSSEVTTAAFLAAINPRLILASNGMPLTGKQRTFDALAATRPFFRTSRFGAITIHIHADRSISVETFRQSPALALN
ncbi:MAG: ComEC/Rec2 family competence protein [Phycisphaerae bacterium]|nr:ComEC/Rec2 family competence protein [Phycisphaerae bacterium]